VPRNLSQRRHKQRRHVWWKHQLRHKPACAMRNWNSKRKSTLFWYKLLIEQLNEALGWKYLNIFYVFNKLALSVRFHFNVSTGVLYIICSVVISCYSFSGYAGTAVDTELTRRGSVGCRARLHDYTVSLGAFSSIQGYKRTYFTCNITMCTRKLFRDVPFTPVVH